MKQKIETNTKIKTYQKNVNLLKKVKLIHVQNNYPLLISQGCKVQSVLNSDLKNRQTTKMIKNNLSMYINKICAERQQWITINKCKHLCADIKKVQSTS